MIRRLLNFLTALSLLLFVAAAVVWVRSERTEDYFWWRAATAHPAQVVTSRGRVVLNWGSVALPNLDGPPAGWVVHTTEPMYRMGNFDVADSVNQTFAGFGAAFDRRSGTVVVPCWFVAVVSALLPGVRAVRHDQRSQRRREQRRHACGYELRATPQRCPECMGSPA